MKVVVIEDNLSIIELYEIWLKSEEFDVIFVSEHFEQVFVEDFWDGVDVAVIDLLLSATVTGVDIIDWMHEHVPHVRKIIVSALVRVVDKIPTNMADAFLLKPFKPDALTAALKGS